MNNYNIKELLKNKIVPKIMILVILIILMYLSTLVYFNRHFSFNTFINGIDVSLKPHYSVDNIIIDKVKRYKLKIIERDGKIEEILGKDVEMRYNKENSIYKIYSNNSFFKHVKSLFKSQEYFVDDLFHYNEDKLQDKINSLDCLNKNIIEPKSVSFKYENGCYEVCKEVQGNKIFKNKLNKIIRINILKGNEKLDLDANNCYETPKYSLSCGKTNKTKNLLNKYINTRIKYIFGNKSEIIDKNIVNRWLNVDENLDVIINEKAINEYIKKLGRKYDTVGAKRKIKTSTQKIVQVEGGFYGWKINSIAETKSIIENIKLGQIIEKEPIYAQKALNRGEDDIGDTYVEINITKQHLWFYKEGALITEGNVVTGNPNRGNSTKNGVYMLNYKQKETTLTGENYNAKVNYWMPFNGNIGIHDASWRYSFGGNIYKRKGSHGCVNAPLYLAQIIFDNIEKGTPIICYEE